MKTTKIISALSLALILFAGVTSAFAQVNIKNGSPGENKAAKIAYVVRVENMLYLQNTGSGFLINLTDETGRQIAPSQYFRPGVQDYTFLEGGTVRGTRVASMVKLPIGPKSMVIVPCSRTGIFYGGTSYLFVIKPIPVATDGATSIH
ncbi:MAG: hypothetical protein WCJ26_10645 [bacterium]